MSLIESIKEGEGYRAKVYKCTEGYDTIGYGFAIKDLELDEEVCDLILDKKLDKLIDATNNKFPFLRELPQDKCEVIFEMVYQLGLNGVSMFKKMLKALERKDYDKASAEMLDSLWAKQTPNRAIKLSNQMKKC
jgi:lysozyme